MGLDESLQGFFPSEGVLAYFLSADCLQGTAEAHILQTSLSNWVHSGHMVYTLSGANGLGPVPPGSFTCEEPNVAIRK